MKNIFLVIIVTIFTSFFNNLLALDYYWVGGNGDWTDINHWATASGGTIKHIQAPTPNDNVIIDNNSFSASTGNTLNLNASVLICRNLDFSQLTSTANFTGSAILLKIYGSLKLSPAINFGYYNPINFEAQSTGFTINTTGIPLSNKLEFNGIGGSWTLNSNISTTSDVFLNSGAFKTNGFEMVCRDLFSTGNYQRTFNIENSIIKLNDLQFSGVNLNIQATNSSIFASGNIFKADLAGNPSFHDLTTSNDISISNSNSTINFHNLTLKYETSVSCSTTISLLTLSKGQNYMFSSNTNHLISNSVIAIGDCDEIINITGGSNTTWTKNSGSINIHWVKLKNIVAAGSASFSAWDVTDMGGNTGWNLHPIASRNLFWVGGTGNWNDTTHWAASSGGLGGECLPTIIDNVIFDNNSFSTFYDSVNIPSTGNCHDMNWVTTSKKPKFKANSGNQLYISGSLSFCASMIPALTSKINFVSGDQGETVKTANHNLECEVEFNGKGSWYLQDSLMTSLIIYHVEGHLNTNNQFVRAFNFLVNFPQTKILSLTTSIIEVTGNMFGIQQDSAIVYPGTSSIHILKNDGLFKSTGSPARNFYNLYFKGNADYSKMILSKTNFHKVTFNNSGRKEGSLKADSLVFTAGIAGNDYEFTGGDSITMKIVANGYCSKPISMRCINPTLTWEIQLGSNSTVNHCNIRGLKVNGSQITANNSTNLLNNTNIIFNNTTIGNKYWVGGTGEWNDSLHWANTSGGAGGTCIPKGYDNVYFDNLSFSGPGQVVSTQANAIYFRDMTWSNDLHYPEFLATNIQNQFCNGSMTLHDLMDYNFKGETYFISNEQNNTIYTALKPFQNNVHFADTGGWTLLDTFTIYNEINHNAGLLNLNGNMLKCDVYQGGNYNLRKILNMSNSVIWLIDTLTGLNSTFYWFNDNKANLIYQNSIIYGMSSANSVNLSGSGTVNLNDVLFLNPSSSNAFFATSTISNTNRKVEFQGNGNLNGNHIYDTLIFSKGKQYMLYSGKNQTIILDFIAQGSCNKQINIACASGISKITKNSGAVDVQSVTLKNIEATGGAIFTAFNSVDYGGNSGWTIIPNAPRTLYWVEGSGNWNDTTHWSLISGGLGGECIPTSIDDVFIDSNSTVAGLNLDINISIGECHDINLNQFASSKSILGRLNIHGSLFFNDSINSDNLIVDFRSDVIKESIFTNGNRLGMVNFYGLGSWILKSDLTSIDSIYLKSGLLQTNDFSVSTNKFHAYSTSKHALNLGKSNIYLTYSWIAGGLNFFLNSGSSNIIFYSNYGNYRFVNIGTSPKNYHNMESQNDMTGTLKIENIDNANVLFNKVTIKNHADIYGEHFFDSLIFSAGNTYKFEDNITNKIGQYWYIRGNNCFAVNLQSTKLGATAYVEKNGQLVSGDYINMRDITAFGSAQFYAGNFSTNISNNNGWIFSNGPNYIYGLGADTNFSIGNTVTLSAVNFNGDQNTSYLWSTGSTGDTIVVSQTGMYYITVTYANSCEVEDSIYVGCEIDATSIVTNNRCFGDSMGSIVIQIVDTTYFYTYLWFDGSTSNSVYNLPADTFQVTIIADSGKCSSMKNIIISQPPEIQLPFTDSSFCQGDSILIDLSMFSDILWNDGFQYFQRWVSNPSQYILKVYDSDSCWSLPDTITINEDIKPISSITGDLIVCDGEPTNVETSSGYQHYLWSNGDTTQQTSISIPGIYYLLIHDNSCEVVDTFFVNECAPVLEFPNVFTPNNDGYNDKFVPKNQNIEYLELVIYDRWGMKLFTTNDLANGWDGRYNGKLASEGVYFYTVKYRTYSYFDEIGKEKMAQGFCHLLYNDY